MFEEEETDLGEPVDFNTLVEATPEAPLSPPPVEEVDLGEPLDFTTLVGASNEESEDLGNPVDFQELVGDTSLTQKEVINDPQKIEAIRAYMVDRKGHQWLDRTPEEVMDAYVSHMRWVSANEVNTIGEYIYITGGDDSRKEVAGNAYRVFEELSSFLTNDGGWGALEGVKDYASAVMLSPSTWIGGIIGRAVSTATTTTAKKAIMEAAIKQAYKTGGPTAAKEVIKGAARQTAFTAAGTATALDAAMSTGADAVYQMTMMESGVQDDYSLFQGAVAATGGLVGGAVTYFPEAMRGTSGLQFTKEVGQVAKEKRRASAVRTAAPKVKEAVQELTRNMKEWKKMVEDGSSHQATRDDMLKTTEWFFDINNPKSPINIIISSGAEFDKTTPFTHQAIEFVRGLPPKHLKAYNKELKPLGIKFGELLDIVADTERVGGTTLGYASNASRAAKKAADLIAANRRADTNITTGVAGILDTPETKDADKVQAVRYAQSLWRRMLISHPGTTAINVLGWSQAYAARSFADLIHGGVLGSYGLAGQIVGGKFGSKQWKQSQHLMANQAFKARTLLDPYESREGFEELLKTTAPERLQKIALRDYFGGVGQDPATFYGINPANTSVKAMEGVADFAARATLVKTQDTWTKTFSGLSELDLVSRMEFGKGISQLVRDGEANLITEAMWDRVVSVMLKDTFSYDYAKGSSSLNKLAKIAETLSEVEGIGFLFPFGKFMNNAFAFSMQYSPLGLLPLASKLGSRSLTREGRESISEMNSFPIGEQVAKATVGTVALMMLMDYTGKSMEQGMQWNEVEDSTGTITNRQNLAPISVFMITSRMLELMKNDEVVPAELWGELSMQLGPGGYMREVGGNNLLAEIAGELSRSAPDEALDYQRLLVEGIAAIGGIVAGATRPLDVPNRIVGMATENNVAIDKRQASGMEALTQELTKYTTNLFAPFIGEPVEEGGPNLIGVPLRSSTQPGDIRDPNPVSSALGRKEVAPKTPVQILLGQVNFPDWKAGQRTAIPEFDAFVNERVEPMINRRAAKLLKNPNWEKLSRGEKLSEVKKLFTDARDQVKDWLDAGDIGKSDDRLNHKRRIWTALPELQRDEARKEFNITTPDKELSGFQIDIMQNYMKDRQNYLDYIRENP